MTPFRPTSYDRPGEQISTTPSGLKVTSAKRLMVDSMVRMIQKAENHSVEDKLDEESNNKKVIKIFKNHKLSVNLESIAISIKWQATSDWEDDYMSEGEETILIFLPKDKNSGIVLRNKGYTESFISSSNYFLDEQNNLHIKTIYKSTVSEERISFLSTHVRSRFSTIRNLENNSVIQTSHTSEIRNLASLKD